MSHNESSERGRRRGDSKAKDGYVGQASWLSSNINLVNTIVGAGTLAMSHALSQMGMLLGIIFILWSGLTAGFGLYLQTRCARYLERGSASFFALSQLTYPNAAVIFDAAISIKCFGVGVSYLIIIGDLMPGVVRGFDENIGNALPFLVDRHFWVTAFMLVVIPLSFLRRLDSLKYTSIVALISIGYLVVLVVYHFLKGDTMAERGNVRVIEWAGIGRALSSLPVIVFAYTCHQNMFSILNEIKDNSSRKTTGVIGTSIGSAAFIYVLVAITGYLSFGDTVAGNIIGMCKYSPGSLNHILLNLSIDTPSVASTIGKAAIVILVMFSYPLQVHPCRASIDAVLKWRPASLKRTSISPYGSPARSVPLLPSSTTSSSRKETISDFRFALITTVIIIASYIVAITVNSLDKVLAYVGSTGSTSISFILPGLFYYKISDPESVHHQRLAKENDDEAYQSVAQDGDSSSTVGLVAQKRKQSKWNEALLRKLSFALAVYGFVVMIVCLVMNIYLGASH